MQFPPIDAEQLQVVRLVFALSLYKLMKGHIQ